MNQSTHHHKPFTQPTQILAMISTDKVLILRTCDKNLQAYEGFQWPATGPIEAFDWKPTQRCGNGLHGLLWGEGDYSYLSIEADAKWQIVEVNAADVLDLGDKVKFPRGNVLYSGSSREALALLLQEIANRRDSGVATTTGYAAHSSTTGYAAHSSTTGERAHSSTTGYAAHSSTTGERAHSSTTGDAAHSSTTGYAAHSSTTGDAAHSSTTGDDAHSSTTGDAAHSSTTGDAAHSSTTGDDAHSSTTGDDAVASCLGYGGTARAKNGVLVLAWWDGKRRRIAVGYTGEKGVESGVDYTVNDQGKIVRA